MSRRPHDSVDAIRPSGFSITPDPCEGETAAAPNVADHRGVRIGQRSTGTPPIVPPISS